MLKRDDRTQKLISQARHDSGLMSISRLDSEKECCYMERRDDGNWDRKSDWNVPGYRTWCIKNMHSQNEINYDGYYVPATTCWLVYNLSRREFMFSRAPSYTDVETAHIIAEELDYVEPEAICERCGQHHHWSDGTASFSQRFRAASGHYWFCPDCYREALDWDARWRDRYIRVTDARNIWRQKAIVSYLEKHPEEKISKASRPACDDFSPNSDCTRFLDAYMQDYFNSHKEVTVLTERPEVNRTLLSGDLWESDHDDVRFFSYYSEAFNDDEFDKLVVALKNPVASAPRFGLGAEYT